MIRGSDTTGVLSASAARRFAERVLPTLMRLPGGRRGIERIAVALGHRAPDSNTVERISRRVSAALVVVRPDDPYRVAPVDGGHLLVDLRDFNAQGRIYFLGTYEPELTALLRGELRAGDIVMDVGANLGFVSVLCASLGAAVHAFEPNPPLAAQLRRSVGLSRMSPRVRVVEQAVGERSGSLPLYVSRDAGLTGQSSLVPVPVLGAADSVEVKVTTLDAYCEEVGVAPTVVKIDVEGAEGAVLRGMVGVLTGHPRLVVCELYGSDGADAPSEIIRWMGERGYDAFRLGRPRDGERLLPDDAALDRWRWTNVVFRPRADTAES